jgi:hypothetical protein
VGRSSHVDFKQLSEPHVCCFRLATLLGALKAHSEHALRCAGHAELSLHHVIAYMWMYNEANALPVLRGSLVATAPRYDQADE